jgi:hypothetical protein
MGAMAYLIVNKQLEHLKSIVVLNDSGQHRDTQLIARTMVEGLALIYWAAADRDKRPLQWRACAWVEEFTILYGKPEYAKYKEEIETMLKTFCTSFLKPSSRGKSIGEITPADYVRGCRWEETATGVFNNVAIRKIFVDAGLEPIYKTYYADTSNWVHWNPIGIAEALNSESGFPTYDRETQYIGAIGYISGFNSLLQSAKFLNGHLKLGFNETLDDLEKDFHANSQPTT